MKYRPDPALCTMHHTFDLSRAEVETDERMRVAFRSFKERVATQELCCIERTIQRPNGRDLMWSTFVPFSNAADAAIFNLHLYAEHPAFKKVTDSRRDAAVRKCRSDFNMPIAWFHAPSVSLTVSGTKAYIMVARHFGLDPAIPVLDETLRYKPQLWTQTKIVHEQIRRLIQAWGLPDGVSINNDGALTASSQKPAPAGLRLQ